MDEYAKIMANHIDMKVGKFILLYEAALVKWELREQCTWENQESAYNVRAKAWSNWRLGWLFRYLYTFPIRISDGAAVVAKRALRDLEGRPPEITYRQDKSEHDYILKGYYG